VIDYIGEEPTARHHPSWSEELGTWRGVPAGEIHTSEGVLEPGVYTMVCADISLMLAWSGAGLIGED
jgi:hypothetical protein